MGVYISQSDIESVYGVENVARWSNLDNSTTLADAARIAASIAYAESYVQGRFRQSRYVLPFSGGDMTLVRDWCAKIAGVWLYESRGLQGVGDGQESANAVRSQKTQVNADIDLVLRGSRTLDLTLNESFGYQATAPGWV
jgi:phage gp36-like protein